MPSIEEQTEHWNSSWKDRIHGNKVEMNLHKYYYVINQLLNRPYIAPMEKLDIGCGTGIHAAKLAQFNPLWKLKWTGIDLAVDAVAVSQRYGMNTIFGDIYDFDGAGKKYQVFLFLDSLEHFFDRERLGKKIVELADKEYIVLGNVPMYSSAHGEYECPVGCEELFKFLVYAECTQKKPTVNIYGVKGFPYMFFESSNLDKDYNKWAD